MPLADNLRGGSSLNERLKTILIFSGIVLLTGYLTMVFVIKGKQVIVPDINGLILAEARKTCTSRGLYIKEKSQMFDENMPEGSVIAQDPLAGENVKQGRTVFVTVSSGLKMISVPDLKDQNIRQSRILLTQSGLLPGKKGAESYSAEIPEGYIIAQNPPPNLSVKRNSTVEVLVSLGEKEISYIMPDFKGRQLSGARKSLASVKLMIKKINYATINGFENGMVVRQDPEAGEKIKKGESVILTVNARESEKTYRLIAVKYNVPTGGLLEKRVKITVMDNDGSRDIYNEIAKSGALIEKSVKVNGEAVLQFYVNNELKEERKND